MLMCALFVQTGFVALPVEFLVAASGTMRFFCVPVRIAWISYGL
jgi:mannitol-specific phosphotransferase system IIBC component